MEGHFKFFPKTQNSGINMIEATSFLEGALSTNMDCTGKDFVKTKLLIDTCALIPSGVAISKQFFIDSLAGDVEQLLPSDLNSANGASSNLTMETVGLLDVKIRFKDMSTISGGHKGGYWGYLPP